MILYCIVVLSHGTVLYCCDVLGVNDSVCLPPRHLTFVLSYRRPTLVSRKSANKQCLMKETTINNYRLHIEPLVPTLKVTHDPPPVPRRAAGAARWNVPRSRFFPQWHYDQRIFNDYGGGRHDHVYLNANQGHVFSIEAIRWRISTSIKGIAHFYIDSEILSFRNDLENSDQGHGV